jgi:uncharacterized protein (DUF302 family)
MSTNGDVYPGAFLMSEVLGYVVRLTATRDEAIDKVTEVLEAEGFGVVTRFEMDQAFKEKIGVQFRPYTILGACNPNLAHAALTSVPEIGLMLPFNVTVEADINGSLVRIINPAVIMQTEELADSDELRAVASDAQKRLQRVAESLRTA